ncbi:hypothetical protein SB767_36475, partial [Bacillus sp. SIMBA_069]
ESLAPVEVVTTTAEFDNVNGVAASHATAGAFVLKHICTGAPCHVSLICAVATPAALLTPFSVTVAVIDVTVVAMPF